LNEIFQNRILWASGLAWTLAQFTKFVVVLVVNGRVDLTRLVGAGGMPSSHTAFVSALSLSTGLEVGFHHPLFAVALVFASIVMYDATGVRQAVGRQAEVLNQIVDDLYHAAGIRPERLRELLGHTPIEVVVGALLGITTALAFS